MSICFSMNLSFYLDYLAINFSLHTNTHTHTHIYICIYVCVCVCVCGEITYFNMFSLAEGRKCFKLVCLPSRLGLLNTSTSLQSVTNCSLMSVLIYDTKQSDGEVPVILELWKMRSVPSLPSLRGPLWPGSTWYSRNYGSNRTKLFTYDKLNCLK